MQNTEKSRETKTIKILRVISRLNIGGPAIHVKLLTEKLNSETFSSLLVTGRLSPGEGDMGYLFDEIKDRVTYIPELQREISPIKDIMTMIKILAVIYREKPDILHTHAAKAGFCRMAGAIYNLFSFRRKVKIVHTFHGNVFEGYFGKWKSLAFIHIERWLAGFSDAIVAISQSQKEDLIRKYRIAPANKVKRIRLGFDLKPFLESRGMIRDDGLRKKIGADKNTFIIGVIGRLTPIKNHVMFLEAAKWVLKENPGKDIRFVVIGDGELREELESRCSRNELNTHVHFCGWIKEVSRVYGDIDILALTSVNEGTPVTIIEAMASSVPVVSTWVGGVGDLLGQSKMEGVKNRDYEVCPRGILCKTMNAKSFARALQYQMDTGGDQHTRDRIVRARDFVASAYSQERLVRDVASLYVELVKK
jgi:glycosyltransferase involved in cell wall biosynthesis